MNNFEIIEKLKQTFNDAPDEIPVNILVNGNLANKIHFIHQLMLADNQGYTEEDVYKYIFWCGANKILENLADNVQNDNPES